VAMGVVFWTLATLWSEHPILLVRVAAVLFALSYPSWTAHTVCKDAQAHSVPPWPAPCELSAGSQMGGCQWASLNMAFFSPKNNIHSFSHARRKMGKGTLSFYPASAGGWTR